MNSGSSGKTTCSMRSGARTKCRTTTATITILAASTNASTSRTRLRTALQRISRRSSFSLVPRLAGQNRNNNTNPDYGSNEKNDPANYLEGVNVTSIQTNPASDTDPNRLFSKIAGNDSMMCLRTLPVGSGSELFVDPTCGASARCVSDGDLLAAYRAGTVNNCRIGTSGIDTDLSGPGQIASISIIVRATNCRPGYPYSCKRAANDFLSPECLSGITTTKCTNAHSALTTCQ